MATTKLTGALIKTGSIPTFALGGGVISASTQLAASLPVGAVSSSAQIDYNSIQNKLSGVVSASAQVTPLLPNGSVSSSSQYPGWVTSSTQIDYNNIQNKLSGVVSASEQVTPLLPAGTISASTQVDYNNIQNKLSGAVSSAVQVQPLLPNGSVSSSAQYPGWMTSSAQVVWSQVPYTSGIVSSSTQVTPLLPNGTVSSSAQYPGWVTASSQIDYNSITNKLSGVYSSSTQAVAAIAGQTIAPAIINATGAISGASIQVGGNGTIGGNLTVTGTITATSQSVQYVSSSQFSVATNKITVNTNVPLRFGGLSVIDSGSVGNSGSLYWDSVNDRWLYEEVTGGAYSSAILINGPQNTGATGTERGLVVGRVPVATGDDHIDTAAASSSIRVDYTSTKRVDIESGLFVTGSLTANGTVTLAGIPSSSAQVTALLPTGIVSSSAQYPGWMTSSAQVVWSSVNYSSGIVSSSNQVAPLLPAGTVSSSAQDVANISGQVISPASVSASANISASKGLFSTNVGIGTTTPGALLHVQGNTSGSTATFSGNVTVQSLTETSTIKLKDNITPITNIDITTLNPVRFNWKDTGKEDIGLIAEEVAELFPELVEFNESGEPIGVHYTKLTILLLKTVQELKQQLNSSTE